MTRWVLAAVLIGLAAPALADGTVVPDMSSVDWHLAEVDGTDPGYEATLNLGEAGRVTGQAPCNRYFAALTREGDSFVLGPIGATRMACLQIEGEAEFFQMLSAMQSAKQQEGVLELTGGGHSMVFLQPVP